MTISYKLKTEFQTIKNKKIKIKLTSYQAQLNCEFLLLFST